MAETPKIDIEPIKACKVYKPSELQEILGIGKNAVYKLLDSGVLRSFRIGKHWRVSQEMLDEFMAKGGAPGLRI